MWLTLGISEKAKKTPVHRKKDRRNFASRPDAAGSHVFNGSVSCCPYSGSEESTAEFIAGSAAWPLAGN
jgi:hypothetical protein